MNPYTIVFATNNAHKLREIRQIMGEQFNILSLEDIDCHDDIPETADTLEGNARLKAQYIKQNYGYDCFADDTGLLVDALDGAPGVLSARYAGPGHDSQANMELLLSNLRGVDNRKAHFSTVICLIHQGEEHIFVGECHGVITREPSGTDGFGYDPIFSPSGHTVTFAEMSAEDKNAISHRGRAMQKLINHLRTLKK